MKIHDRVLLGFCLVLMISGCQWITPDARTTDRSALQQRPESASLSAWVDYSDWLNERSSATLDVLYNRARQATQAEKDPKDLLNLALLLSTVGSRFQDDKQAMALLVKAEEALPFRDKSLRDFIRIVRIHLDARSRSTQAWRQLALTHKEEAQRLQQQLDQLKAIEKGLVERQDALE